MNEDEIYTLPDDLGETARSKIVQLRKVDASLARKKKNDEKPASEIFFDQCRERKLPAFVREYEFARKLKRKWKFDFAWVYKNELGTIKLAVEIEGMVMRRTKSGEWIMGGRHATIQGFKEDCIKYSTATLLGWYLMRFEQSQVKSGFAINMVMRVLARNGWRPKS